MFNYKANSGETYWLVRLWWAEEVFIPLIFLNIQIFIFSSKTKIMLPYLAVRTTMIYTHVMQIGSLAVKSPLD